jgi:hypothetical protein
MANASIAHEFHGKVALLLGLERHVARGCNVYLMQQMAFASLTITVEAGETTDTGVADRVIVSGDLTLVKTWHRCRSRRRPAKNEIAWYFESACTEGHLAVAQWLHATFQLTRKNTTIDNNDAFRSACVNGHLAVAQWLYATFQLTREDATSVNNLAFQCACANGHIAVAQWLHATFQLTREDATSVNNLAFGSACENGHLTVAQWRSGCARPSSSRARMQRPTTSAHFERRMRMVIST